MSSTHITLQSISYPYFDEDKNILVNESMILEAIAPEHAIPLYRAIKANAEDLSSFLPWAKNNTIEAEEKFISTRMLEMRDKRSFTYVIKVADEIVGCIDLQQVHFVDSKGNCNVGYFLFPEFRGRGYIKEALSAVTEIFYVSHKIARFNLIINCKNHQSIKVAQTLGAKLEGVLRKFHNGDCYLYGYVLPFDLYEQNKEESERDCFVTQEIDKDLPELLQYRETLELARLLVRSGQSTRKALEEYSDSIQKAEEDLRALEEQENQELEQANSSTESELAVVETEEKQEQNKSPTTETNSAPDISTVEAEVKNTRESSTEDLTTQAHKEENSNIKLEEALEEALEDIFELSEKPLSPDTASSHKDEHKDS